MTGTPVPSSAFDASITAVNCGIPTPAMIRVVQIEPGPMPTFTALTPASANAFAPSPVATLPATTCISLFLNASQALAMTSSTPTECPCAVSITTASAPALTSISILSRVSDFTPTAAATRRRPFESLEAIGLSLIFMRSL